MPATPTTRPRPARKVEPLGDLDPFVPTADRPVRVRARAMPADAHFEPHRHPWAQLAYCASGIVQVTVHDSDEVTRILPPSRAVWIPPGALHAVSVIEAAQTRTLYMDPSVVPAAWEQSRVLVVSPLLRELIPALDSPLAHPGSAREQGISALILDELAHASTQLLGVPLPHPERGDKRLRHLCEAVLRAPGERATLAGWLTDVGASERTMARLFRDELGMSYQQWRQQAVLAHALPLLARGTPVSQVAAATGYASDSAFTAMFKAAMGEPPSHFLPRSSLPTLSGTP